jgi:Uncharacterized conserved protein (DUF2358)
MDNYRLIFWSLRFHGTLFFKHLYVEVKRIWQRDDDTICLRWTVHGFPRLPWDQEGTFDGVSTYKLDSHGKVRVCRSCSVPFCFLSNRQPGSVQAWSGTTMLRSRSHPL